METEKVDDNTWELKGRNARIYASEKLLQGMKEDDTLNQLGQMSELPGLQGNACVMPDGHQGYGFPIGGVAAFDAEKGLVSPGGIGFDINCGVRLLKTGLTVEDLSGNEERLANALDAKIPKGLGAGGYIDVEEQEFDELLEKGLEWMHQNGHAREGDLERCEENGSLPGDASKLPEEAKRRGLGQVGSLGSGNHFLEVQVVEDVFSREEAEAYGLEEGSVMVMIHTGSRGLGHETCSHYVERFKEEFPEVAEEIPNENLMYAPLDSELAQDYLDAMNAAANYAWANRQGLTEATREAFNAIFDEPNVEAVYDVCHNIAKRETHRVEGEEREVLVHRKGATRAFPPGHGKVPEAYRDAGQPVLTPGTMGTRSYVLAGREKSMELSFGSTAHGAGRLKSRTQSKQDYWGEDVKKELEREGIEIRADSGSTIAEEAPGSYKDVDEVIKVTEALGIASKVARLRPLINVKG